MTGELELGYGPSISQSRWPYKYPHSSLADISQSMYPEAYVIGSDLSPIQPTWYIPLIPWTSYMSLTLVRVPPNLEFEVQDYKLPLQVPPYWSYYTDRRYWRPLATQTIQLHPPTITQWRHQRLASASHASVRPCWTRRLDWTHWIWKLGRLPKWGRRGATSDDSEVARGSYWRGRKYWEEFQGGEELEELAWDGGVRGRCGKCC